MDYEKYKVKMEFPNKPRKPVLKLKATPAEIRAHADEVEQYENAMVEYRKAAQVWRDEQNKLEAQFKDDVIAEYGLKGHPKADKVFAKAWEHGHSSGYSEVAYWVGELAELVLD